MRKHNESLLREDAIHKEAIQGINILKNACYKIWTDINEPVIKEWGQLGEYQKAREQVSDTSNRINELEMVLDQQEENGKKMMFALQNLTDADLQAIEVTNKEQ